MRFVWEINLGTVIHITLLICFLQYGVSTIVKLLSKRFEATDEKLDALLKK